MLVVELQAGEGVPADDEDVSDQRARRTMVRVLPETVVRAGHQRRREVHGRSQPQETTN